MEHETSQPPAQTTTLTIPIAIIIAGVLIAGAVYLGTSKGASTAVYNQQPQQVAQQTGDLEQMKAISKGDHIRGNPDAPVKIVEYSDTECPFCKRFHGTM